MESILLHIEHNIATITFNRPKVFNSINKEMALRFQAILDEVSTNEEVRVIVLTGNGRAFGAGQDIQEILSGEIPLDTIVSEHYNPIVRKIRSIEKPFVAAINGIAAGASVNIALACDVTIAKESAAFMQAFSQIGLIPDSGGTFTLPKLVGFAKASALMMLADKVPAKEAEAMGMIYKVVADDEFDAEIQKTAVKLSKMPPIGLGLTKRLLNESFTNDMNTQLERENVIQDIAGNTEDYFEGIRAFVEKRKPVFKGK